MSSIFIALLLLASLICLLELKYKLRASSPLQLDSFDWDVKCQDSCVVISGWLEIKNPHPRMEVMIPEMKIKAVPLGEVDLRETKITTKITSFHPDQEARKDGYWTAYILKSFQRTRVHVLITLQMEKSFNSELINAQNLWVEIHWVNYGPFGRLKRRQGLLVPILHPKPVQPSKVKFNPGDGYEVLPIKTHLLGVLDDPIQILQKYAGHLVRSGDILTIGETPLAIMQGRYLHPSSINPGYLAKILCKAFHPTSSLATACGLQALIDIVGPSRVLVAWSVGVALKLIGIKGGFYRLAGQQARLIDDITGTTPPYDQTIVLGPKRTKNFCKVAASEIGIPVAIVDVNDLGRVKVLAASSHCNLTLLEKALSPNPAGNADEQTPLVLIRPK